MKLALTFLEVIVAIGVAAVLSWFIEVDMALVIVIFALFKIMVIEHEIERLTRGDRQQERDTKERLKDGQRSVDEEGNSGLGSGREG